MRRLLALLAVAVAAVLAVGAGGEPGTSGTYRVDAIFDSASFLIAGQDVKIAGAKVGSVEDVSLTSDRKARIAMSVDGAFGPFRSDARCTIQPQSLIGEKFIQCVPGTPAGTPLPANDGTPTVALANTSAPVDLDLVLSTFRMPTPQRAALVVSGLGGGLAGRDKDLSATIRRAAPALQQTRDVLDIVQRQTRTVASLVEESDRVIGVLARRRGDVTDFIETSSRVATTTGDRRSDLRATIRGLPALLRETRPALASLERLASRGTPALEEIERAAPSATPLVRQLSTFTRQVRPALGPVARAAREGRRTVAPARPVLRRLRRAAVQLEPTGRLANDLLQSMKDKGAIEGLQSFIYWAAAATARFDRISHILPAYLLPTTCTVNTDAPDRACDANFVRSGTAATRKGATRALSPPRGAREGRRPAAPVLSPSAPAPLPAAAPPPATSAPKPADDVARAVGDVLGGLLGGGGQPAPAPSTQDGRQGLLDYLLG